MQKKNILDSCIIPKFQIFQMQKEKMCKKNCANYPDYENFHRRNTYTVIEQSTSKDTTSPH